MGYPQLNTVAASGGGGTAPDASTTTKGIVQLAGDLAGTSAAPQIAVGAITNEDISATAGITMDRLVVDPRARANHTGTQLRATVSDFAHASSHQPGGNDQVNLFSGSLARNRIETMPRIGVGGDYPFATSPNRHFSYFTPASTRTITAITTATAGQSASTTTLARTALYTVNEATGDLTIVAVTANDTALWGSAFTTYTRSLDIANGFPASYTLIGGTRYAFALVFDKGTGNTPSLVGKDMRAAGVAGLDPVMARQQANGGDFPTTPGTVILGTDVGVQGRFFYASFA